MKLVFFGTSGFACPAFRALDDRYGIELVVTQPDRPAGRHAKLHPSPVKQVAFERGLALIQPNNINDPEAVEILRDISPDVIVVASYGQLLKAVVFDLPQLGTINIHASLLPAYRGAAPVNWAIMHGEARTGVATFFIEKGLDTGDVLMMDTIDIGPDETAIELEDRLANLGADVILKTLQGLANGSLIATPQPTDGVSLAPSLTRENGHIDWCQPAAQIHNLIRGMLPWPGAWTTLGDHRVKIHRARLTDMATGVLQPGVIGPSETNRLLIGTGDALLEVPQLQREGKSSVHGCDFLHGIHLPASFV
ncbi:methionyl-tRNA formyltransferase [Candidatus Bipolaricaulota bacterium]|nr:methionyl-tRNA formyltransferase [Candidatus Bipolaricaulota bacterium]